MTLFDEVIEVLKDTKANILGNPISEAMLGIQEASVQLVKRAGLPEKIVTRYSEFSEYEGLLYSSESYRDHFFHPFHTFLLGFLLLGKSYQLDAQSRSNFPLTIDDNFLKEWLVTSLWHDVTYAASKGPDWLRGFIKGKLDLDINAFQDWSPLLNKEEVISALDILVSEFSKDPKTQLTFRRWLHKQLLTYHDHAVLSALLLLIDFEEWPNLSQLSKKCSLAIALHNYHVALSSDKRQIEKKELSEDDSPAKAIGSLKVADYPLAFMLAYCDSAQEWGRPNGRNPFNYITFDGIEINPQLNMVKISLKYDVSKLQGDENKVLEEIEKREMERIKNLGQSWKSENWIFYIQIDISGTLRSRRTCLECSKK